MYSINDTAVVNMIESSSPRYGLWVNDMTAGGVMLEDEVFRLSFNTESSNASDDIELGAITAAQLKLLVINSDQNYLGSVLDPYFYLRNSASSAMTYGDLEAYTCRQLSRFRVSQIPVLGLVVGDVLIPIGQFTCVRCRRSGGQAELTLYDALYFADKIYTPKIKLPAKSSAIENDICRQLGITNGNSFVSSERLMAGGGVKLFGSRHIRLRSSDYDFTVSSIPAGTTMRQMLSYIASANGQFGCIDREGRYVRRWYGSPIKTIDQDTINSPTLSEQQNKIVGLICQVSDSSTLTVGETGTGAGRVLEFANPYMTAPLMRSLFHQIKSLTWNTAEIHMRLGDPRLDIGDVIAYEDEETHSIPVTSLALTFDGGLSADISAAGISVEEQIDYS